ncbi:hypothetical protein HNP86_001928 [Methanococcus maripaludis]|uniref:Uncharacterized protein n=1 Tax=Methanococcus maripaludis TaxID=39152 RepID=A0A7J9NVR2_METMI|nr:hypothetical protein [Methanococcus maripaludis]MBA2851769.1 hypothetical protein [Methanococcus maripaludis]
MARPKKVDKNVPETSANIEATENTESVNPNAKLESESKQENDPRLKIYDRDDVRIFYRQDKLLILKVKPVNIMISAEILDIMQNGGRTNKEVFEILLPDLHEYVEVLPESDIKFDVTALSSLDPTVNPLSVLELHYVIDSIIGVSNLFPEQRRKTK